MAISPVGVAAPPLVWKAPETPPATATIQVPCGPQFSPPLAPPTPRLLPGGPCVSHVPSLRPRRLPQLVGAAGYGQVTRQTITLTLGPMPPRTPSLFRPSPLAPLFSPLPAGLRLLSLHVRMQVCRGPPALSP